jgi:hypothetical protein
MVGTGLPRTVRYSRSARPFQVCQAFELAVMFYSGPLRTGNLRSLYPAPPPMVCMAY